MNCRDMTRSLRYEWNTAPHGAEVRDGNLTDRDEVLDLWAPRDAERRLAALPGRLASLRWPITDPQLVRICDKVGFLVESRIDSERSPDDSTWAASANTLRLAIF